MDGDSDHFGTFAVIDRISDHIVCDCQTFGDSEEGLPLTKQAESDAERICRLLNADENVLEVPEDAVH
jgi:hypothetical protein